MFPKYIVIITQFGSNGFSGSTIYKTFFNVDDAHECFKEFCDSSDYDVAMFRCIKQHYETL